MRRLTRRYNGQIVHAYLFGSVARGEAGANSDVDILLIAENPDSNFKWEARGIAARVSLEHDVLFNLHIYSRARWSDIEREQSSLHRNVRREGIELKPG